MVGKDCVGSRTPIVRAVVDKISGLEQKRNLTSFERILLTILHFRGLR